jgi:16S rRNA (guanine527-N7)-methyltransferase
VDQTYDKLNFGMPILPQSKFVSLLQSYLSLTDAVPQSLYLQLSTYLDLLLKWNARTNLTAIREPEEIVCRHFGESLFAGRHLGSSTTLLDFGSGAGFPGLPIALLRPEVRVTLAESQNKKATFLREAIRTLGLQVEVWPSRVETMPESRTFDAVTLRAVDNMANAISAAHPRAARELLVLGATPPILPSSFTIHPQIPIPGAQATFLIKATRIEQA